MAAAVRTTFAIMIVFGMFSWICLSWFSTRASYSKLKRIKTLNKIVKYDRNEGSISSEFNTLQGHSQRPGKQPEVPEIAKNEILKNETAIKVTSVKALLIPRTHVWSRHPATNVSNERRAEWTQARATSMSSKGNPGPKQTRATKSSASNISAMGVRSGYPAFVKNTLFYNKQAIKQEFCYIHSNSDLCTRNHENKDNSIFLLVMVLTAPGEAARRSAIRQTWGNVTKVSGKPIATIFLLASSTDAKREQIIEKENDIFHDICKKDFIDSYENLTLKVMMGFEWVNSFCNESKFVLKIDSDMIPNLRNLVNFLDKSPKSFFFNGHMMNKRPVVRNRSGYFSKWYVPREEYPHVTYPPYELGAAYVLSTDLISQAVSVAPNVPLFRFEDVYVGMLMKTLDVNTSSDSRYIFNHDSPTKPTRDGLCSFSRAFTIDLPQDLDKFWRLWNDFDEAQCNKEAVTA